MSRCSVCNEYLIWERGHKCAPEWECRMEWLDDGDDWQCVRARDAEDAAAKYAERYDCDGGEYAIVSGKSDAIVLVRADGDETPLRFRIEAEAVPQYWARHIKPQSVG